VTDSRGCLAFWTWGARAPAGAASRATPSVVSRGAGLLVSVVLLACSGGSGTADAWYDAGAFGSAPYCPVSSSAKQYNLNGVGGPAPSALPSGACSTATACVLLVATGPYGDDESAGLEDYTCECIRDAWTCKGLGSSGGVVTNNWCDGGRGTMDGA